MLETQRERERERFLKMAERICRRAPRGRPTKLLPINPATLYPTSASVQVRAHAAGGGCLSSVPGSYFICIVAFSAELDKFPTYPY